MGRYGEIWDAEQDALVPDLLHALERHRVDGGHVVVAHLLAARRVLAHDRAPGQLKIGAAVVVLEGKPAGMRAGRTVLCSVFRARREYNE